MPDELNFDELFDGEFSYFYRQRKRHYWIERSTDKGATWQKITDPVKNAIKTYELFEVLRGSGRFLYKVEVTKIAPVGALSLAEEESGQLSLAGSVGGELTINVKE